MNIWSGLLFLDGHIADAGLARSLLPIRAAREQDDDLVAPRSDTPSHATRRARRGTFPHHLRRQTMRLFQTLMYLGGRPMTAGHNYDIEEPFPQAYGNRIASDRMFKLKGMSGRNHDNSSRAASRKPEACTQC